MEENHHVQYKLFSSGRSGITVDDVLGVISFLHNNGYSAYPLSPEEGNIDIVHHGGKPGLQPEHEKVLYSKTLIFVQLMSLVYLKDIIICLKTYVLQYRTVLLWNAEA